MSDTESSGSFDDEGDLSSHASSNEENQNFIEALIEAVNHNAPVEEFRSILETAPEEFSDEDRIEYVVEVVMEAFEDSPDPEILRLLIEKDPEVARMKIDHDGGGYLLHGACEDNAPIDIIRLLLELNPGAVRERDDFGEFPLNRALDCTGDPCFETVELLIDRYDEALRITSSRNTWFINELPLHRALRNGASTDIITTLLNRFPDAAKCATGARGSTENELALHIACRGSRSGQEEVDYELVRLLFEAFPAGALHANSEGALPIHIACSFGSLEAAQLFLEHHADEARAQDGDRRLPLHYAASGRAPLELVQLLIESFPDGIAAEDNHGMLPLHIACLHGAGQDVVECLTNQYQSVEEDGKGGLNVADNDGEIPLHLAARISDTTRETLEYLLRRYPEGINVRVARGRFRVADDFGMLPLHIACCQLRPTVDQIRCLLDMSPYSILEKTHDGHTALQLASHEDADAEVTGFLLEKQTEAALAMKEAFENVADTQLGLPDLVVAYIWSFAKPVLWETEEEDNDRRPHLMRHPGLVDHQGPPYRLPRFRNLHPGFGPPDVVWASYP